MKAKVVLTLLCVLASLSCTRMENAAPAPAAPKRMLTVRSLAPGSATLPASLEVLAFRTADPSHVYGRAQGNGTGVRLMLEEDTYRIYALGNMPSFGDGSETQLLNAQVDFVQDGDAVPMVCTFSRTVNTRTVSALSFEMERLRARIVLEGGITVDNGALCSVFVLNIPERTPLFGQSVPGAMINHRTIGLREDGTVLDPDAPAYTYHNGPVSGSLSFYAHPNSAEEAASRREEDDVTKVVLAVRQDGKIRFFPIGLPNLERNHTYTLSGIHVGDRPGSLTPNSYVPDIQAVRFSLSIAPFVNVQTDETI